MPAKAKTPVEEKKTKGKKEKATKNKSPSPAKEEKKKGRKAKDRSVSKGKEEEKKEKKVKDKAAPKKAMTSFMAFGAIHRPQIMKDHPDWKIGDIGKELGRMWAELDDKAKEKEVKKLMDKDKKR